MTQCAAVINTVGFQMPAVQMPYELPRTEISAVAKGVPMASPAAMRRGARTDGEDSDDGGIVVVVVEVDEPQRCVGAATEASASGVRRRTLARAAVTAPTK